MRPQPVPSAARRHRGIVVVEAAIVLPVVLLLMLAVAEVGRALYQYNTLQKTIRDATRHLAGKAISDATGVIDLTASLITTTRTLAVYGKPTSGGTALLPGFTTSDVSVSSPDALHVQVSASYTYTPMFIAIPTFGMGDGNITVPTTLTAELTMRAL